MPTNPVKAIAFDVYGTLLRIADRRDPYKPLLLKTKIDRASARRLIMTRDLSIPELLDALSIDDVDPASIEEGVQAEVESVVVYEDVLDVLARLREQGVRIAAISNLAPPYAEPIRRLLGEFIHDRVLSFAVGMLKPEAGIFALACERLGVRPDELMMVGDSVESDVEGALSAGLRAVLLDRRGRHDGLPFERVLDLLSILFR